MKELLKRIKELISQIEEYNNVSATAKEDLELVKMFKVNPESIKDHKDEFVSIFPNYKTDNHLYIIYIFADILNKNKNESQVEVALANFDFICSDKISELNKSLERPNDFRLEDLLELYSFLETYDSDKYFEEKYFDLAYRILPKNDDSIEFLFNITLNNAKIEEKRISESTPIRTEEEINEMLEQLPTILTDSEVDNLEADRENINKQDDKVLTEFVNKVKGFLNNTEYQNVDSELFKKCAIIFNNALNYVNDRSNASSEVEAVYEMIKEFDADSILEFDEAFSLIYSVDFIINLYAKKDYEGIKAFIEKFAKSPYDRDVYLYCEGLEECIEFLSKAESDPTIMAYYGSMEYLPISQLNRKNNDEHNRLYNAALCYREILYIIADKTLDDNKKNRIKEVIEEANKYINTYQVSATSEEPAKVISNVLDLPLDYFYEEGYSDILMCFLGEKENDCFFGDIDKFDNSERVKIREEVLEAINNFCFPDEDFISKVGHNPTGESDKKTRKLLKPPLNFTYDEYGNKRSICRIHGFERGAVDGVFWLNRMGFTGKKIMFFAAIGDNKDEAKTPTYNSVGFRVIERLPLDIKPYLEPIFYLTRGYVPKAMLSDNDIQNAKNYNNILIITTDDLDQNGNKIEKKVDKCLEKGAYLHWEACDEETRNNVRKYLNGFFSREYMKLDSFIKAVEADRMAKTKSEEGDN